MEKIIIAIPALNEAAHIENVVSDLLSDLPSDYEFLLVVADGRSSDRTVAIVEAIGLADSRVKVIDNPNRNQAAAVNAIARQFGAGSRYIIRCDAHAIYPRGFIRSLIQTQRDTGADSIVIPMDSVGTSCFQRALAWVSDTKLGSGGSAHRGGRTKGWVDHGHHALFVSERFVQVGGYEEFFVPSEDTEYDARQRSVGAKVYMDSDIRIGYFPRKTIATLWRQYYRFGGARAKVILRYPASTRMRQIAVPFNLVLLLVSVLAAPLWPYSLGWAALYGAILAGASVQLAIQHRSACGLLAGVAAGTMHVAYGFGFWISLARNWRIVRSFPSSKALDLDVGTGVTSI